MSEKFDVVIVGGGMGGLALALFLGRLGRSVAVVERQAGLQPLARGELLQPNGLRILAGLGLLENLSTLPSHTADRFHFHRIGGGRLCTVDYRTLPPPWNYTLILRPHHLLHRVMDELKKTKGVRLLNETEFSEPIFEKSRLSGIRALHQGRPVEVEASVVVGSDGAHSRIREALGIRSRVHVYREAYLTAVVPRPEGFERDARYYMGRGEILGLFPVSEQELYFFYMIPAGGMEKIKREPLERLLMKIARIDPSLDRPLKEIVSWEQLGYMPCVRVRAERWATDRAVLMGDAAHAMNPHVAQGRNQALEDARVLSNAIEKAFQKDDFSAGVFRPYELLRRPVVELLQDQSDEMVLFWNSGFPPVCWLRDRVFKRLDHTPLLRYKMLTLIAGLSSENFTWNDRLVAAGFWPRVGPEGKQ